MQIKVCSFNLVYKIAVLSKEPSLLPKKEAPILGEINSGYIVDTLSSPPKLVLKVDKRIFCNIP
jgi:hypothetical protein